MVFPVGWQKSNTLDKQCNVCVYSDGILRKLVIEELEKLQILPVGYTEGIPEQRRKGIIGNGWTIDVITYILKESKLDSFYLHNIGLIKWHH